MTNNDILKKLRVAEAPRYGIVKIVALVDFHMTTSDLVPSSERRIVKYKGGTRSFGIS